MKYNEEQKFKAIQKNKGLQKETVRREKKLMEKFPVEVEIRNGYYVIESKINFKN